VQFEPRALFGHTRYKVDQVEREYESSVDIKKYSFGLTRVPCAPLAKFVPHFQFRRSSRNRRQKKRRAIFQKNANANERINKRRIYIVYRKLHKYAKMNVQLSNK
ncbi:hypothetical protein BDFB_012271, partial [Asbolus verrucosus]